MGSRPLARGEAGCRSVRRQARDGLSADPATSEKRRVPSHRAFRFCDGSAPAPGAALFGYFLALLPKSNSPVGENPRPHYGKADAARDAFQVTRSFPRIKSGVRMTAEKPKLDPAPRQARGRLCAGMTRERGALAPRYNAASRRHSGRTGEVKVVRNSGPSPQPSPHLRWGEGVKRVAPYCKCASRNHKLLSSPRDTPVNRSEVPASPRLAAVSIALRVLEARAA